MIINITNSTIIMMEDPKLFDIYVDITFEYIKFFNIPLSILTLPRRDEQTSRRLCGNMAPWSRMGKVIV